MSCIILRGRWCDTIVLNVHTPAEDKIDDIKNRFYEELEHVFDKFPKYHMTILLGDFNAKVDGEYIFKPKIWNESLHEISNDNGVRVVSFATSKDLTVRSTMFPQRNIHKFTWTSPDGKIHNQIEHILIDRRWHSSILDVLSFRAAECDTDNCPVVEAKVRERLALIKQTVHSVHMERFSLKKLNEVRLDQRKQAKLQWLQDPNGDNLNNIRCETSRHFRNKKREYQEDKIDELAVNSKKNIRDLYRGINDFKRGYQPSSNLVKDENGDLFADSHNILNGWKNYFSQLLNVHRVSDVRQIEIHTAELLVLLVP
ncbi:hypothetical protein B7P43_G09272 [Cryptotermes secundus]|uniref:Endonuclease/exonuclease/phosphatase domain-containing protein n=1 Tax=Cryptotermes secundus TaxID=105785 RepID=A0A2J7R2S3_9NEOP|nr:hypothetical protein B7P43_G09272 [Cryptotermes secundus]